MSENEKLIKAAEQAMANAYVPYSNFKVGAALLTADGKIYTGCNIENISYGATVCAERCAIFKAVSEGESHFTKLAIVSSSGEKTFPCGMCRQVIEEFMPDGEIILSGSDGIEVFSVKSLMPHGFHTKF